MNPKLLPAKTSAREIKISKQLSYLLRHGAHEAGLKIDTAGWARLDDLLKNQQVARLSVTQAEVFSIVANNDKQRFALEERNHVYFIRCNQGHSQSLGCDLGLLQIKSITEIPTQCAVHGTTSSAWSQIRTKGLSRMKREHIHFAVAASGSEGVISGMRATSQVLIYLNVTQALQDGIPLFFSENKVVLSPGIDGMIAPKYFEYVLRATTKAPFDPLFPSTPPERLTKQ